MKITLADSAAIKGDMIKSEENVYEKDLEIMNKMNMFRGNHLFWPGYIPEELVHNYKLTKSKHYA